MESGMKSLWDLAAVLGYCSHRAEMFSTTLSSAIITHTLSGMAGQQHFCPVSQIRGAERL